MMVCRTDTEEEAHNIAEAETSLEVIACEGLVGDLPAVDDSGRGIGT